MDSQVNGARAGSTELPPSVIGVRTGWPMNGQRYNTLNTKVLILIVASGIASAVLGCTGPSATDGLGGSGWGGGLVASVRSEPRTFNRLVATDSASGLVSELTQAPLVRINKVEDRVEPWLAESWRGSTDGASYELDLRPNVRFSDGAPFTSADVAFSFAAVYDPSVGSPLADALRINGKPLEVVATNDLAVTVTFPEPFSPGLRILAQLPILPKHRLAEALEAGTLAEAWDVTTQPEEIAGLGPFVLSDYRPGQRLLFSRNLNYWRLSEDREQLPRLDRLTLEIVPDQNTEILRLEAGEIDFTQTELRAEDYASLRRAADQGRAQLIDLGVALDADFLFFNLKPEALEGDERRRWLQAAEFRRAVSQAVERSTFAETVYLGLGEPVYGPITASNRRWYDPDVEVYDYDPAAGRERLARLGLSDRDGDGRLEDGSGDAVRFTLLTQRGHSARERAAAVIAHDLGAMGVQVDVVALEFGALIDRVSKMEFDAVYLGFRANDTDPASNMDLWLSGSAFHFWNPNQPVPATEWEARIDELMVAQSRTADEAERKRLFGEVQQIFAEFVPAIYFAAPRVVIATSLRVANARPALLEPFMLWNADTLAGGAPQLLSRAVSP